MENRRLSENFTLHEFLVSDTAVRMGRDLRTEPVPHTVVANLRSLCVQVLQPVRNVLTTKVSPDIRIHITSGYRPPWLNRAIGGSRTSDHRLGRAADYGISGAPDGFSLYDACDLIIREMGDLPYDQLIYEGGRWIHQSWRHQPRQQILTATFTRTALGRRKTLYQTGLHRVT